MGFLFIVIFFKPVVSCDKVTEFLELSLFLKKPLIKKFLSPFFIKSVLLFVLKLLPYDKL